MPIEGVEVAIREGLEIEQLARAANLRAEHPVEQLDVFGFIPQHGGHVAVPSSRRRVPRGAWRALPQKVDDVSGELGRVSIAAPNATAAHAQAADAALQRHAEPESIASRTPHPISHGAREGATHRVANQNSSMRTPHKEITATSIATFFHLIT
jgi:hypothetical protein